MKVKDEIVDDVHAIKQAYASQFDYDLDRIVEETRRHQRDSGRTYGSLSQDASGEGATDRRTQPSRHSPA